MKYELPGMEIIRWGLEDTIITGLSDGGTSSEIPDPNNPDGELDLGGES